MVLCRVPSAHFHFFLTIQLWFLGPYPVLSAWRRFSDFLILNFFLNCVQFSWVIHSCPILFDPMDCSTPVFPTHHQLLELLKLMSMESVIPSNHLILCHPLLLLPSIFPSIRSLLVAELWAQWTLGVAGRNSACSSYLGVALQDLLLWLNWTFSQPVGPLTTSFTNSPKEILGCWSKEGSVCNPTAFRILSSGLIFSIFSILFKACAVLCCA